MASISSRDMTRFPVALTLATCLLMAQASGQAPGPNSPPAVATTFSGTDEDLPPDQLQTLVAPVALYPDDLLAIVLPASTQPLQLVDAQRFLDRRTSDPKAQPPKSWDPSVIGLLNYPEVIALMNHDLTWTQQLGTSVIKQQPALMDAIQSFRQKVQSAGNLKSDEKQTVTVEKETIVIQPANPEVIYVPTYNPTTVIYAPAPGYPPPYVYSAPYPYYYSPAATFATGVLVGASIGYAMSWNNHGIYHGNVNINTANINNVNVNRANVNQANINRTTVNQANVNRTTANQANVNRTTANQANANRTTANQANANRLSTTQTSNLTQNRENAWRPSSTSANGARSSSGGTAATRPPVTSSQSNSGLAQRGAQPTSAGTTQRSGSSVASGRSGGAFAGAGSGAAASSASARGNQSLGQSGVQNRAGAGAGGGRRR